MKKHSKALVFFAVSKQIPIVYSADRGRAEKNKTFKCEMRFIFENENPWTNTVS